MVDTGTVTCLRTSLRIILVSKVQASPQQILPPFMRDCKEAETLQVNNSNMHLRRSLAGCQVRHNGYSPVNA